MSSPDEEPAGPDPVAEQTPGGDDDGGPYGIYGEGRPRHVVGDSDEPPRRRPRTRPAH
jgi:hypothetical protein